MTDPTKPFTLSNVSELSQALQEKAQPAESVKPYSAGNPFSISSVSELSGSRPAVPAQAERTRSTLHENMRRKMGLVPPEQSPTQGHPSQTIGDPGFFASLGNAGKSFLRGAGAGIGDIPKSLAFAAKGIDNLTGSNLTGGQDVEDLGLYETGEAIQQTMDEILPPDERFKNSFLAEKLPGGLGSMGFYMALGFFTGGAGFAPAAANAGRAVKIGRGALRFATNPATHAAGGSATVRGYEEAKMSGEDEETAVEAGGKSYHSGAIQVANVTRLLGRFDKYLNGKLKSSAAQWLKEGATSGFNEMVVESVGQAEFNRAARNVWDEDRELMEGVIEQGQVGGAAGAISGMLVAALGGKVAQRREAQDRREEPKLEGQSEKQYLDKTGQRVMIEDGGELVEGVVTGQRRDMVTVEKDNGDTVQVKNVDATTPSEEAEAGADSENPLESEEASVTTPKPKAETTPEQRAQTLLSELDELGMSAYTSGIRRQIENGSLLYDEALVADLERTISVSRPGETQQEQRQQAATKTGPVKSEPQQSLQLQPEQAPQSEDPTAQRPQVETRPDDNAEADRPSLTVQDFGGKRVNYGEYTGRLIIEDDGTITVQDGEQVIEVADSGKDASKTLDELGLQPNDRSAEFTDDGNQVAITTTEADGATSEKLYNFISLNQNPEGETVSATLEDMATGRNATIREKFLLDNITSGIRDFDSQPDSRAAQAPDRPQQIDRTPVDRPQQTGSEQAILPDQQTGQPQGQAQPETPTQTTQDERSSTQFNLDEQTGKRFVDYSEHIPESDLYTAEEGFGRETEPHVTLFYGLTEHDPAPVQQLLEGEGDVEATLGKVSIFENPNYDVVKVEVDSPKLKELHEKVRDELPNQTDFPDYQPHITLAYTKPGKGQQYVGDTQFEGQKLNLSDLVHSSPDRTYTPILLKQDTHESSQAKTTPVPQGERPKRAVETSKGERGLLDTPQLSSREKRSFSKSAQRVIPTELLPDNTPLAKAIREGTITPTRHGRAQEVRHTTLAEILPEGTTEVYHDTSLQSAKEILARTLGGPRSQHLFVSDQIHLALGQGGKGVIIEFDPATISGTIPNNQANKISRGAGFSIPEYVIDDTLARSVAALRPTTQRQVDSLKKEKGLANRFDFDNIETTEHGFRIPRRVQQGQGQQTTVAQSESFVQMPLSGIQTDVDRFQNRDNEYSEDTVTGIVDDVNSGKLNPANLPPILTWQDPQDNNWYVVGGHSRIEAFKRLGRDDIQAQRLTGLSEQQAMDRGRTDNFLGTQETLIEGAKIIRDRRKEGKSKKEIEAEASRLFGANKATVLSFAHLNPQGKALTTYKRFAKNETGERGDSEKMAKWVGEARQRFPDLTNSHENELYNHLLDNHGHKGRKFTSQSQFLDFVGGIVERNTAFGEFESEKALNIQSVRAQTNVESEWHRRNKELLGEIAEQSKKVNVDRQTGWNAIKAELIERIKAENPNYSTDQVMERFGSKQVHDVYVKKMEQENAELRRLSDLYTRHQADKVKVDQAARAQQGLFSEPEVTYEQIEQAQQSYTNEEGETAGYVSGQQFGLFDDPPPTRSVQGGQASQRRGRAADYLTSPSARRPDATRDEFSTVERHYRAYKQMKFHGRSLKVESAGDVAFMFQTLEKEAVEHVFAVYVDAEDRPVIQHVSTGGKTASLIDPDAFMDGINRFGAKEVYFVHNHPSGTLRASRADYAIHKRLSEAVPDGVILRDGVIINLYDGKYATFNSGQRTFAGQTSGEAMVELKPLSFSSRKVYEGAATMAEVISPQAVGEHITGMRLSTGDKMQVLLLNNAKRLSGRFTLNNLNDPESMFREISALSAKYGGHSVVLGGRVENREQFMANVLDVKNKLRALGTALEDVVLFSPGGTISNSMGELDPRFRRTETAEPTADQRKATQIKEQLEQRIEGWAARDSIVIADSFDQVPVELRRTAETENIGGIFYGDKAYVLTSRHKDADQAFKTLLHEIVGHGGVQRLIEQTTKNKDEFNQRWNDIRSEIHDAFKDTDAYNDIARRYDLNLNSKRDQKIAAEEYIAHLADTDPTSSVLNRIVQLIRDVLRKAGVAVKLTDTDIKALLSDARKLVEQGDFVSLQTQQGDRLVDFDTAGKIQQKKALTKPERTKGSNSPRVQASKSFYSNINKDRRNSDPRFLKLDNQTIPVPEKVSEKTHVQKGKFDRFVQYVQNAMLPIQNLQKTILSTGGAITDESDVFKTEETHHGKVETERAEFDQTQFAPLRKAMKNVAKKYNIKHKDIVDYLYARYAPTRNQQVYERNKYRLDDEIARQRKDIKSLRTILSGMPEGNAAVNKQRGILKRKITYRKNKIARLQNEITQIPRDGSGMSDEQSAEILNKYKTGEIAADMKVVGKATDSISQYVLDKWLDYGLITKARHEALSQEDGYVPLRGFEETIDSDEALYVGDMHAKGRKSKAGDVLSYLLAMADTAIIKGERNRIMVAFAQLVKDNPDPSLYHLRNVYYVDSGQRTDEGKKIWNATFEQPAQADFDAGRAKREIDNDTEASSWREMKDIETIPAMINGRKVMIEVRDPDMAKALKRKNIEDLPKWVQYIGHYTGFLRNMYVQYNPEFSVRNFMRDSSEGFTHIVQDYDLKTARSIFNPAELKRVMGGIRRVLRGGKEDSEYARWFQRFRKAGGMTGYWEMDTIKDRTKELERLTQDTEGGFIATTREGFRATKRYLEEYNRIVENAARMSAFKHLVEKKGMSDMQAASYAKNLTVNFNRKGEAGPLLGQLFLFFNAAIQGPARVIKPFRSDDPRVRRKAMLTPLVYMGSAVAMAEMLRWGMGADDDGEDYYDKQSDYIRMHHILIPNLLSDKEGAFFKYSLPYGYNAFWAAGDVINRMWHGKESAPGAAFSLANTSLNSFSPLGGFQSDTVAGSLLRMATPTLTQSLADLAFNEDFAGRPIYPESFGFSAPVPQSRDHFKYTSPVAVELAKYISNATGGDGITPGAVELNPSVLEYLVRSGLGGTGNFVNKTVSTMANIAMGVDVTEDEHYRSIPFASTVMQETGRTVPYRAFADKREQISDARDYYNRYLKSGEQRKAAQYYRDNRKLMDAYSSMNSVDKMVKSIWDRIDALENLSNPPKPHIDRLREQQKAILDRFNKRFNENQ